MTGNDVNSSITEFKRTRTYLRIAFVVLFATASLATAVLLVYSGQRAKHSEIIATEQEEKTKLVTKSLETIANSTLDRVLELDRQALDLTRPKDPTVYLWRYGLSAHREQGSAREIDSQVAVLLHERKFLLGNAGPSLSVSPRLKDYTCEHIGFVIGESIPTARAKDFVTTMASKDPRYQLVEWAAGSNDASAAIIVGFS